ncbi:MAG: hypothetical protein R3Y57_05625 [Erysipelotrichaceae bacterium]
MKKLGLFVALVSLLTGCASNNIDQLETKIQEIASSVYTIEVSNYKEYYDYYVNPGLKVVDSTKLSSLIQAGDNYIVLNINVSNVVNEEYYNEVNIGLKPVSSLENVVTYFDGQFLNIDDEMIDYKLVVYLIDGTYMVYLNTTYVDLYSILPQSDITLTACEMMIMAKSVQIEYETIASDYSNINQIDYVKEQIKLFEVVVPESGRIEEILLEGYTTEDDEYRVDDNLIDGVE